MRASFGTSSLHAPFVNRGVYFGGVDGGVLLALEAGRPEVALVRLEVVFGVLDPEEARVGIASRRGAEPKHRQRGRIAKPGHPAVDSDGLWIQQLRAGSENLANGRNVSIRVTTEGEDGESKEGRYKDFIMYRIVGHVMNRASEQRILSGNCSDRLCSSIRQPGECRNLRMAHSV